MWVVVHFIDESNVVVVPSSWVDGDYCWWPQNTTRDKLKKLVEKEIAPGTQTYMWTKYKARTLGNECGKLSHVKQIKHACFILVYRTQLET